MLFIVGLRNLSNLIFLLNGFLFFRIWAFYGLAGQKGKRENQLIGSGILPLLRMHFGRFRLGMLTEVDCHSEVG